MAGGIGSRFWPWIRTNMPKQFIDILNTGQTLLQQTFERLLQFCPAENVYIVTHQLYKTETLFELPLMNPENVLLEPMRRNTAPCIAYVANKIYKKCPDACMIVVPADHIILANQRFTRVALAGLKFATENEVLLTCGINPHRPETGYGYIKIDHNNPLYKNDDYVLSKVSRFVEKPDYKTAVSYLADGNYKWNSGMFIWSVKAILKAFETYLPDIYQLFAQNIDKLDTDGETKVIKEIYQAAQTISIDYGIMEKADNVYSMATDLNWSDIGTWGSLYEHCNFDDNNNALNAPKALLYESHNCYVKVPENKVAVIYGLSDYIVVDTENALLICPKNEEQKIRNFVEDVKGKFGESYI